MARGKKSFNKHRFRAASTLSIHHDEINIVQRIRELGEMYTKQEISWNTYLFSTNFCREQLKQLKAIGNERTIFLT